MPVLWLCSPSSTRCVLRGFLTLKKQMEAATPLAPDGSLRVDTSVPERAEYEQQIEALQDGKRALYERYLMGEIDLNTYKAEKAACDELLLKTKNAYAAVLAQAKQKQDEQARQDSRKEASKAIFDADTLTTELAELLIDRVLVYPDKRIEIAYKICYPHACPGTCSRPAWGRAFPERPCWLAAWSY